MKTEEVNEIMKLPEMDEAVMIGSVEERESYFPAIVGYDKEKGRFKYDYNELCHCFAEEFRKSDEESGTVDPEKDYETDGVEWVEYNVIRSLPYWGEHAPEIVYPEEDQ
jgi:hypothetical protein